MDPQEKMREELRILARSCHAIWMPVFFGALILYSVLGYLIALANGGAEVVASLCAIGALILAFFTAPLVDAIYYEICHRAIMNRYRQTSEQEGVND